MAIIRRTPEPEPYTPRPQLAAPGAASGLVRKARKPATAPQAPGKPEHPIAWDKAALERPFTRGVTTAADLRPDHLGTVLALTVDVDGQTVTTRGRLDQVQDAGDRVRLTLVTDSGGSTYAWAGSVPGDAGVEVVGA